MSDEKIEDLQNSYADGVYAQSREKIVERTSFILACSSSFSMWSGTCFSLLGKTGNDKVKFALILGLAAASGMISSGIGYTTNCVLKKTCCKRSIEQEKWEAQGKAEQNIIFEDSESTSVCVELDGESYL